MKSFRQIQRFLEKHGDSITGAKDFECATVIGKMINGKAYKITVYLNLKDKSIRIDKIYEVGNECEIIDTAMSSQILLDLNEQAIKYEQYELLQVELLKPRGNTFSDSLPFSMD